MCPLSPHSKHRIASLNLPCFCCSLAWPAPAGFIPLLQSAAICPMIPHLLHLLVSCPWGVDCRLLCCVPFGGSPPACGFLACTNVCASSPAAAHVLGSLSRTQILISAGREVKNCSTTNLCFTSLIVLHDFNHFSIKSSVLVASSW